MCDCKAAGVSAVVLASDWFLLLTKPLLVKVTDFMALVMLVIHVRHYRHTKPTIT